MAIMKDLYAEAAPPCEWPLAHWDSRLSHYLPEARVEEIMANHLNSSKLIPYWRDHVRTNVLDQAPNSRPTNTS